MDKIFELEQTNLKKAGLKITAPRVKILELFEYSDQKHLTADDVYRMLVKTNNEVSIATVYRVLTQFEQSGILDKHNFDGEHSVFELKSVEHHDHLLCVKCNKINEFVDTQIEQQQVEIAKDNGFEITDHCMIIYGICDKCR